MTIRPPTPGRAQTMLIKEGKKKYEHNNIVIPYVSRLPAKLRGVFSKHRVPVFFSASMTVR